MKEQKYWILDRIETIVTIIKIIIEIIEKKIQTLIINMIKKNIEIKLIRNPIIVNSDNRIYQDSYLLRMNKN